MELLEGKTMETQDSKEVSTKQQRIAELAERRAGEALKTLAHHMDIGWLKEAFQRTRKDGATGVDGVTARQYAQNLEGNLAALLERAKSGNYRAPPVRRVHIPKGDGKETRPIGIPTFEDKVLQRAVVMLLEPIYERDFKDCSHGFRPGRSPHTALESFWKSMMGMGGGWVLEVDLKKFFDSLPHQPLQQVVRQRVCDGVVLRLIGKWLNAGVMEEGRLDFPDAGTPQGGVISPLLANVFLHEVLDEWFEASVKPRLHGRAFMVRYADDLVIGFELEDDARRVLEVLPKRAEKYGLTVHPEKTRLVYFRPRRNPTQGEPGSFDFLGFTHLWSRSRKESWVIKRRTASSRFTRALRRVAQWCRAARSMLTVREQHAVLSKKLWGHYGYYGITGNSKGLSRFRHEVIGVWRKWLDRRSQRQSMSWQRLTALLAQHPLPPPRVLHSVLRTANP
jgi:group II intron reverse transcriptase/maturase